MAVTGVSDLSALFSATKQSSANSTGLSVNDFLTLLAAQLRNQDMMNPMNDTEFMSQLAQLSSLQAMQDLTMLNLTTYSVSLIGQEVTTARLDSTGKLIVNTGTVTGIGLFDGDPIIYIGNDSYSLGEIMVVGRLPEAKADENTGGENGGDPDNGGTSGD